MTSPLLAARAVTRSYRLGETRVTALAGVDLEIGAGEFVALAGPSGSGKSTLLHLLGALDAPDAGSVAIEGRDLATLSERERTLLRRRRLGFVFQSFHLVPVLSALENVEYPLWIDGVAASLTSVYPHCGHTPSGTIQLAIRWLYQAIAAEGKRNAPPANTSGIP